MEINYSKLRRIISRHLDAPIDIGGLAAFRILFGLVMAGAMARFMAKGWVQELFLAPPFHFTYPGFEWVQPWPGPWMHAHFILLIVLALGIAAGCFYRVCSFLFFLGFTYVELIDQTTYLNHYYLISLISGLLVFLPAHRAWSIDVLRAPKHRLSAVPSWTFNLLRFQISLVYLFAGLAKLNADWLLHAEPLRIWLPARSDLPIFGHLLAYPWVAYAASWGGVLFDLTVVPFLCWPKTRPWAYGAGILFHAATGILFNIGIFPWIMAAATTLFFSADWPRRGLRGLTGVGSRILSSWTPAAPPPLRFDKASPAGGRVRCVVLVPILLYAAVQLFLPLRPYLSAQPSVWTGSGFNCAWQVMIVEKTGYAEFYACDSASGQRWKLQVNNYLTPRQEIMMAQDPYLIRFLARRMAEDLRARGHPKIQIKVDAFATLNARPSQRLIDPQVDLAGLLGPGWILPLAQ